MRSLAANFAEMVEPQALTQAVPNFVSIITPALLRNSMGKIPPAQTMTASFFSTCGAPSVISVTEAGVI